MSRLSSVVSLLSGYVRVHDNLTLYEHDRVVINSRNDSSDVSRVKLISGGGSGHEPAHAGYVGDGMLTASICGDLYSSPSTQYILNGMLMSGSPKTSILFIVKNYTGDRMNFGLALELARSRFNYKNIDMIIINDDISIDDNKVHQSVGRRGLAGTIFYHKIIGAMAAKRKSLSEICYYANRLLSNNIICTVGFTFTTKMPEGLRNIEIGKGIHGEPGVQFIDNLDNFDNIHQILIDKFLVKIPKNSNVILMVNNLGGTALFIMNIFLNEIIQRYSQYYKIIKTYTGHFLGSLNSEGISVTLINLSDPKDLVDIMGYLEYETSVPCNIFELNVKTDKNEKSIIKDAIKLSGTRLEDHRFTSRFPYRRWANLFRNIILHCTKDLIENTDLLNQMDSEFGDGDTGAAMTRFATQINEEIENDKIKSFDNPKLILMQLAEVSQAMGAATGAIYSLFLQGLAFSMIEGQIVDLPVWAAGVTNGIVNIMKYSRAQKGDRTLLEPLIACSNALTNYTGIQNLKKLCDESVAATQYLIPKSGRAAYTFSMNETKRKPKFPDPGAKTIGIMVNAIAQEIITFNVNLK